MNNIVLTLYVLIWPAIAAAVMGVVGFNFFKEWRQARREGRGII